MGLAFLEKMAAVTVILPLVTWLVAGHLPRALCRAGGWADRLDGSLTIGGPARSSRHRLWRDPQAEPGTAPAEVHEFVRCPFGKSDSRCLASAPPGCLDRASSPGPRLPEERSLGGRAAGPRDDHVDPCFRTGCRLAWQPGMVAGDLPAAGALYRLNVDRKGSLEDIDIMYFGKVYIYSLPWHNAWVLIAVTVPVTILAAGFVGSIFTVMNARRDRLPLFFVSLFVTLPVLRMLPTPAHDGVRLLLPSFFFLAALAGWGAVWLADGLGGPARWRLVWSRSLVAVLVLGPAVG